MPTGSRNAKSKPSKVDQEVAELLAGSEMLADREDLEYTFNLVPSVGEWRRNFKAVEIVNGQIEQKAVKARGATQHLAQHDLSRRVAERDNAWADHKGVERPWTIVKHVVGVNRAVYVVTKLAKVPGPTKPLSAGTLVGGAPPNQYGPQTIKIDRSLATVSESFLDHRAAVRARTEDDGGDYSDYTHDKDLQYLRFLDHEGIGGERMSTLPTGRVRSTMDAHKRGHASTTTWRFSVAMIAFGEWALSEGVWGKNLFAEHPRGSKNGGKDPGRVLSFREIDAWFRYAVDKPWMLAALWLLRVGCRSEDILGLSERDVLDDETIIVRSSQKRASKSYGQEGRRERGARLYTGKPKGFSRRKIVVGTHVIDVLRLALETAVDHEVRCHMAGMEPVARRFAVHNSHGEMFGQTGYAEQMRAACERIGFVYGIEAEEFGGKVLKTQYSHMWKHTFASELVALGADDVELREVARHADVETTKSIYAKSRGESKKILRHYANLVDDTREYIPTIVQMDLDRRSGMDPWGAEWAVAGPLEYPGLLNC